MLPLTLPFLEPAALIAKSWWKAAVGAAVVAAPIFLMGQCSGANIEKGRTKAANAVAVASAVSRNSDLKEAAGAQRATDTAAVANLTTELTNAVAQVPDATPDPVAVALGCQRLRNAGRDTSAIPACRGPQGAGQAGPGR